MRVSTTQTDFTPLALKATGSMADKPTFRHQSLKEDEKERMRAGLAFIAPFRNIRNDMPLQYVTTFLLVALDEGQSVKEYARRAGVAQSVMTRHLLDIGERNRHMGEGFGLITQRADPLDLRTKQAFLTDKGRMVANQIVNALKC